MPKFKPTHDQPSNLLPKDGTVHYYGAILTRGDANRYRDLLLETIDWRHDEIKIFGRRIITKRQVAWYGDHPFSYTYSKVTKTALPWTQELLELKEIVEHISAETYNSCLLNLYHDGSEGMSWHSDGERDLVKNAAIASLSLGAERKFAFKHRDNLTKVELLLAHGSLLVMKDETQSHWRHRLPPSRKIHDIRINLTFRTINF